MRSLKSEDKIFEIGHGGIEEDGEWSDGRFFDEIPVLSLHA